MSVVLALVLALSAALVDWPAAADVPAWPFTSTDLCLASHGDGTDRPSPDGCKAHGCCILCASAHAVAVLPPATVLPWTPPPAALSPVLAWGTTFQALRERPQWPRAPPVGLIFGDIGA